MKVIWILQSDMVDNDRFKEAIEKLPDHHIISFRNLESREDVERKLDSLHNFICPFVFIRCNIKWARYFLKFHNLYPGVLGNPLDIKPSTYRKWVLDNSLMANSWVDFTTWGFLGEQKNYWLDRFDGKFFIKPDTGTKTFTGQVFNEENFDIEYNFITKQNFVDDSQRVMIGEALDITEELRAFYVGDTLLSYSEYSWEENPKPYKKLNQILRFANKPLLKEHPMAYTIDFGLVNGEPKIIEFNSLSCSGIYNLQDIDHFVIKLEDEMIKNLTGGMNEIL